MFRYRTVQFFSKSPAGHSPFIQWIFANDTGLLCTIAVYDNDVVIPSPGASEILTPELEAHLKKYSKLLRMTLGNFAATIDYILEETATPATTDGDDDWDHYV